MNSEIKIPLNKLKIGLLTLCSIGFVYVCYFILWNIMGIIGILFFGATGIYGLSKLFDFKTGLKIDSKGITDNTNATSIGLIEWKDITGIRTEQVVSTKFLLIDVNNPEKYIKKAKNRAQKKLMKANMSQYYTPITITSNSLNYNFKRLENLVLTEFKKNKNTQQHLHN